MSLQSRISSLRPSRRGRTRGQALVELALILPLMVLLLAAALDLGRLFYSGITVTNAAREGAIEAAIDPALFVAGQPCNATTNRVMCRTINETAGSFVTIVPADVSLVCDPSCAPAIGNRVKVTVVGHFSLITPLLSVFTGGQNVTLRSTASAQIIATPILGDPSTPAPTASPSPTPTPTPSPSSSVAPTPSGPPTPVPSPICLAPTNVTIAVSPTSGFRYKNPAKPGTTFRYSTSASNMTEPLCHPIWTWNFGDGAGTSSLFAPQYVYLAANTSPGFTVTITASTDGGKQTASFILKVATP
jgi:Flp pilus assembly protein TadG